MKKKLAQSKVTSQKISRLKNKKTLARIKVVGVGGGGGNIVSRMMQSDRIRGVEFIAINTDAQDLDHVMAHRKIYVGKALTRGLGAGMNPEIGKQAVEENRSEIGEALDNADIVFVTAGLGGGTGTGGGPIVAEIAREKGILTIAIVTKPFTFEGSQRANIAQEGLARFKDKVDALVVVPNDRIFGLISKDTPLMRAFGYIDDVLRNTVQAIADLINVPGIINVDFADIKTILKDAGLTLIGTGFASGPERSIKAVNSAINSPLLEISIDGAKGVLFSVSGGKDLKMAEINDIAKAVAANLDANARIIFGTYHDRNLKDKNIKVTVIATGFNGIFNRSVSTPTLFVNSEYTEKKESNLERFEKMAKSEKEKSEKKTQINVSGGDSKGEKTEKEPESKSEPWEIPAFLRKRRK